MPWFRREDGSMAVKDDKDKVDDIEFKPEKLKEDITKDFETKLTKFGTDQDAKMKPLLDMAANIEKDRLERERKAAEATAKKERDDNSLTNEDFMLDPKEATRRAIAEGTSGLTKATMMLAARGNIRETLQDKEYYHGDFKAKVDEMVAQQSLENQCRPDVVENCYLVQVAKNMKEIQEGKIKARTSSATFEGGSTGGHKADSSDTPETLTADEEKAAAAMNIKKEDWIKSRRELSFV